MRFGRLVVIDQAEDSVTPSGRHHKRWLCQCDCGNVKEINADNLTRGLTLSCGCLQKEQTKQTRSKHGDTDSRLYNVWCSMKSRCYTKSSTSYHRYGGRGIKVCDEWLNSYEAFRIWAYSTGYDIDAPRGKCTLDRIDNNIGYSPENCRWVTQRTQMNNVSYNHYETYNGETHTIAEWARLYDMPYNKLLQRLDRYGMDIAKALDKA